MDKWSRSRWRERLVYSVPTVPHDDFEVDIPGARIRLMTGRFPRAASVFRSLFGSRRGTLEGA